MPKFIGEIIQNGGDFALIDSNNIRGGFIQVKTTAERDSVSEDKLKINLLAFVEETDSIFRYTTEGWVPFKVSDNSIHDFSILSSSTMVREVIDSVYVTVEDGSVFELGDIVGYNLDSNLKGSYGIVKEMSGNTLGIDTRGNASPKQFDTLYLVGNVLDENSARQLVLILHKINGVVVLSQFFNKDPDAINTVYNLRLGQDKNNKWRVYADDVYLKGDFIDRRGRNISDLATVEYESLRREFGYDNLINNPSFITGFNCWDTTNEAVYFTVAGKIILTDQILLSSAIDGAYVIVENGQTVLKLMGDSHLTQVNSDFRDVVDFEAGPNTWFDIFYTYKSIEPGTLVVKLNGEVKDSFEFSAIDYKVHRGSFKWDGVGDLEILCSGKVKIKSMIIRPNEVKTLIDTYNLEPR